MAKLNFDKTLNDLGAFYKEVAENPLNRVDEEHALYGSEQIVPIKKLIEKYYATNKKTYLRQLRTRLMNISRGVEYFQDYETDKRHREIKQPLYWFHEEIETILKAKKKQTKRKRTNENKLGNE